MNGKAYYLDLQTLLDYLSVHGETCILSTALKERKRTGYVVVRDGAMTTCYISEGEKVVLQGKQAYKALEKYSEWHVQLQYEPQSMRSPSASPPPTLPPSTPYSQPLPPTRSGPLSPAPGPNFSSEQSPAPRPGSSSGQLPATPGPGPATPRPGPVTPRPGPVTPRPGSSSGRLPAFGQNPTSGQGPAMYPGSPPNNQLSPQRPYTPNDQRPVQRSNVPMNWFPVIKRELSQQEFMALPARQRMVIRMVLTMVNGRRNVEEIKAQLQLSPGTVESVLEYLRALKVIE